MKPAIRTIYFLVAWAALAWGAYAQDFSASLSRNKVGAGERFRLTYTIRNRNMESLALPKLTDFVLVGGPYNSNSTQIVNGNYSSTASVSYDLACMKPGRYSIGPATLKSGGQTFTCNTLEVEVGKDPAPGGNAQQNPRQDPMNPFGQQQQQPVQDVKITKNDLFVVTSLSKPSVYPGEAVTVTYKLYTRFPQVNIEDIKFPEYHDAWMNELKESGDKAFSRETYNGQTYNAATLQKTLFIPQRAGSIDIKPVTATVLVQFVQRSGNFWDDFFNGGRTRQERLSVTGNPTALRVKEYPESGRPETFNGATGQFTMAVSTDKPAVSVNDAVTLKVVISGTGNLSLLDSPQPDFHSTFEVFDPKSSEKISAKPGGVSGSKTFEYLIIPRSPGKYTIDPVRFSYFDPQSGKYNTLVSDSLPLTVTGDLSGGTVTDASGHRTENLAEDIRYLKTGFDPADRLDGFFPGTWFFALLGLFMGGTAVLWFTRTKIWDLRNDTDRKKIRIADAVAVKRLKQAELFLQKDQKSEFYEACYRAVIQYLQDRMGLELGSISAGKVRIYLLQKGVSEALADEAAQIIEVCELARFAPPGTAAELTGFHMRCIRFISNMEKK